MSAESIERDRKHVASLSDQEVDDLYQRLRENVDLTFSEASIPLWIVRMEQKRRQAV